MVKAPLIAAAVAGALALSGCAVAPPSGPDIVAMPGKDKSFEAFQADDVACRQYASAQIGNGSPAAAANQSFVNSAALGTVLGAAAGAAIGAATGNPAVGAAIGAGSGLFLGGATGVNAAGASGNALQWRYDTGYAQCMAAKGESVTAPAAAYPAYPSYPYAPGYYPYPYYPYYPYYGPAFLGINFAVPLRHFRGARFHRFHR
jgi:hypothetical protein